MVFWSRPLGFENHAEDELLAEDMARSQILRDIARREIMQDRVHELIVHLLHDLAQCQQQLHMVGLNTGPR